MRKLMYLSLFVIFTSCDWISSSNPIHRANIYSRPYQELIVAIKDQNLTSIEKVCRKHNLKLDHADIVYGVSLLNWCIFNDKVKSYEKLLELGANPNWQDTGNRFAPPITEAARVSNTSKFLELSLKHNGNPNILSKGMNGMEEQSPLFAAIFSNRIENVQVLLKHGADVNLTSDSLWTPLAETLVQRNIKLTKYLLDNGANYSNLKFYTQPSDSNKYGKAVTILDFLRKMTFDIDSDEYRIKMEVVAFLKRRGLNYWNHPIPENVRAEFQNDPAYLEKY